MSSRRVLEIAYKPVRVSRSEPREERFVFRQRRLLLYVCLLRRFRCLVLTSGRHGMVLGYHAALGGPTSGQRLSGQRCPLATSRRIMKKPLHD